MRREYDTFVQTPEDLTEGKEIELTIRDLSPGKHKYESLYVKAVLSAPSDNVAESDVLRARSPLGFLYSKEWAIRIVGTAGEYQPNIT